jgi:lipid A 3-O-deacylase
VNRNEVGVVVAPRLTGHGSICIAVVYPQNGAVRAFRLKERLFLIAASLWVVHAGDAADLPPGSPLTNTLPAVSLTLKPAAPPVWERGLGQGFTASARQFTFELGGSYGWRMLGSQEAHDFALASLTYGHMLGGVQATNHWFRGNWQWRMELFGGWQFRPDTEWIGGVVPHLRYNFATGSPLVPFVDGGLGFCLTTIRGPDLGGIFQFSPQAAVGLNWFFSKHFALSAECRIMHFSSAHLELPNQGVNTLAGLFGVNWFF